jgi:hypothetical protein
MRNQLNRMIAHLSATCTPSLAHGARAAVCASVAASVCAGALAASEVSVPAGPNSWTFDASGACIPSRVTSNGGIKDWSDPGQHIRTYFWVGAAGLLDLRLNAAVASGTSRIRCSVGQETKVVALSNSVPAVTSVGTFTVARPGYQVLDMQGLSKSGATFAEITCLKLSGPAAGGEVHFIKDDFYFGRRGPSVHLGYRLPKEARDLCWLYNEVSVPAGLDALGTYCMANGFGEGYCGMQVNSPTERRILFSVWSPFHTNDPKAVPESDRVALLKKGTSVHAQAFGGEGSGGQSYLVYPWRAGTVYRFLLHGEPAGDGATVYTAYFYPPEEGKWLLLASFKRPKTNTYLRGWHSFLENFSPDAGAVTREGTFANQWARDRRGVWFSATEAVFTADATAHKGARLDYTGGTTADGRFFLRNCGFFSDRRDPGTVITRPPSGRPAPAIDFDKLPEE